jgi:hypothetical protein
MGLRLAVLPLLKDEIVELVETLGGQTNEAAAGEAESARGKSTERK